MPRGRKKRLNREYTEMKLAVPRVREQCICLLNGICLCPTSVDEPTEVEQDKGMDQDTTTSEYPGESEPDT